MSRNIEDISLTSREELLVYLAVSQTTKRLLSLVNHAEKIMHEHPNRDKPKRAAEYEWQRSLKELQYRLESEVRSDWYTLESARLGEDITPYWHDK